MIIFFEIAGSKPQLNRIVAVQECDVRMFNSVQMPGAKKYFMKRTESYL
jgi:hypothetical protein